MATTHNYELPITCYQASELIRKCFEIFKHMNIRQLPTDKILKLGKHLVDSSIIDLDLFKDSVQNSKGNRTHLLESIWGLIGRENFRSCDILLDWMDKNGLRGDAKDLERRDRQYCLENMVRAEEKSLTQTEYQERLEMYARSERFIPGTESANTNCMYQALYRAIDKPSLLPNDFMGLKVMLTAEYMTKHKPKQYLVELDDIGPGISKTWSGFVAYLQQKKHHGHPLVLMAAALKFNFVVHVTSMAALEEFALYPENRTVQDGDLHHVYLAHIQKQHYVSLVKIQDPRPFTYEELQLQLNKKSEHISEIKQSINKIKTDQKFKETQMASKIKKLEDENHTLSKNLDDMEQELQTATEERGEKIRKLENKMQKLREEIKTLKQQHEEHKREHTHLMDDIKQERQNTLDRQEEQIQELYRIIGEQTRSSVMPTANHGVNRPELYLDFTGASSEQMGTSDTHVNTLNRTHLLDTDRSTQSRTFVKSSSLNRSQPQVRAITRQNTHASGVQSEPTSRRNSLENTTRPQSETENGGTKQNAGLYLPTENIQFPTQNKTFLKEAEDQAKTVSKISEKEDNARAPEFRRKGSKASLRSDISRSSVIEIVIEESEETQQNT